ncbi:M18 family aminopeptidase [Tepidibacter formicigenes]|jgi:aspartyl aminopeptidase|uniref:M18 family aminopeptidase n=1 Tax=Tepidibacter formicigenes DSM 15518 TaxID=1123349 RepID=A0A1M6TMK8_9FIRM|nr:M18 family aminopeptidase [Tepidibacter formicigenes]SHK58150.1 aspartyl aminopeptidase [Tepidibacter formicigenes DSM 15518]
MKEKEFAKELIEFISNSPTSFHAVKSCKEILKGEGFKELSLREKWDIKEGGKYFVTKNSSAITAFIVNSENIEKEGFRIIASHSDAPSFRVKPNPEMISEKSYLKLNTETYGGPILNTWMDRPLSIAGRVTLKSDDILKPKEVLVNINKPICIIPNVAIHMNRNVNSGIELNKQVDMLPLLGMINENFEKDNFLIKEIAKELNICMEDILDFDMFLYEYEKGSLIGINEEFISSSRLDNLAMAHASINAFINSNNKKGINVFVMFDNEEIGSATRQGADSPMLKNILERINLSLKKDREDFFTGIYSSFMISADMAHPVHPNKPQKHDPTNRPIINKGPVIKISSNYKYTSDSYSIGVYENICREANVPYQKFVNKSDERGGSTIGPISSTHLDIPSVDIGTPILAMHSIRELGGVIDHYYAYKSFLKFYEV